MWQDTLVSAGLLPPILLNQVLWQSPTQTAILLLNSLPSILTFTTHRHLGHCLSSLILLVNLPVSTRITLKTIFSTSFRSCNLPGDYTMPPAFFFLQSTAQHQPLIDFFMSKPQEQQYEVSRTRDWRISPLTPFGLLRVILTCCLLTTPVFYLFRHYWRLNVGLHTCTCYLANVLPTSSISSYFFFTFWDKSRMFKYLWSSCISLLSSSDYKLDYLTWQLIFIPMGQEF